MVEHIYANQSPQFATSNRGKECSFWDITFCLNHEVNAMKLMWNVLVCFNNLLLQCKRCKVASFATCVCLNWEGIKCIAQCYQKPCKMTCS